MRAFRAGFTIILLALCLLTLSLSPALAQDDAVPRFDVINCPFSPSGVEVTCGTLAVPEDRTDPDNDRTITLAAAILHSRSDNPAPDPVVKLIGGPGGITLPYISYQFRPNYVAFLRERDFIMLDQRGIGYSEPSLDCPDLLALNYDLANQDLTRDERMEASVAGMLDCRDDLAADGINLNAFTSAQNAADLNDLRIALGYDEWNMFGGSYGTRLALTAMRDTPEGIRSVILDSSYPLQSDLYTDIAANQQRAFDLLFTSCANDDACNAAFPDLEAAFYAMVDDLNAEPRFIEGFNAQAGLPFSAYVTGDMVSDAVFGRLYRREEIPGLPLLIARAVAGDEDALAGFVPDVLDGPFGISEGMYWSIQCGEEVAFGDLETTLAASSLLNPALRDEFALGARSTYAICAGWGMRAPDPVENMPVVSDIPALVLSGEFDPITPPEWGRAVAADLSNSFFFEFPTVGHGVIRSDTCARDMALAFLNDPTTEPDSSCMADLPPLAFDAP
jgi:pimeloyl-ACP methyl ester carboxylesterase